MVEVSDWATGLEQRINDADARYGAFASTHEAMGVAMEEWDEFRDAVRLNNLDDVRHECLDLAAVMIRLARALERPACVNRSRKDSSS